MIRAWREWWLGHLELTGHFEAAHRLAAKLRASGTAERVRMERPA